MGERGLPGSPGKPGMPGPPGSPGPSGGDSLGYDAASLAAMLGYGAMNNMKGPSDQSDQPMAPRSNIIMFII